MNTFGLDIGTTLIKICQTQKQGNKIKLLSAGLIPCPAPGMASEAEPDLIAVASAIKKLHQDSKILTNKVVVGLPEGQIFSRVIEMPKMNGYTFMMEKAKVEAWVNIPVVVLTAHDEMQPIFSRHKIKAYLVKPLKIQDLIDKVAEIIGPGTPPAATV